MFLLDTDVVSELRKTGDGRADANVLAWLSGVDVATCYVSAVTLMELERAVLRIERRDALQGSRLRAWMERHVLPAFSGRTLPVDTAVAIRCASLHGPERLAERDAFIASTALVHAMTVVTRNPVDFEATGVTLLNPWNPCHDRSMRPGGR